MTHRRPLLAFLVGLATVGRTARLHAIPLQLSIEAPPDVGCPDIERVRELLRTHRYPDPFDAPTAPTQPPGGIERVRVQIVPTHNRNAPRRYQLTVFYLDRAGAELSRAESIEHPRCQELANVAVFQMVDALQLVPIPVPTPPPAPPPPPPLAPPPIAAPPPTAAPPPPPPPPAPAESAWSLGVFGGGGLSLGSAPAVAAGGFAGLTVSVRWLRVELEGRAESEVRSEDPAIGEFLIARQSGSAAVCLFRRGWGVCGVGRVGRIEGHQPTTALAALPYFDLGARGIWELQLRPSVWFRAQVELATPVVNADLGLFETTTGGAQAWRTVWSSPALSGNLGLGVFVRLW